MALLHSSLNCLVCTYTLTQIRYLMHINRSFSSTLTKQNLRVDVCIVTWRTPALIKLTGARSPERIVYVNSDRMQAVGLRRNPTRVVGWIIGLFHITFCSTNFYD